MTVDQMTATPARTGTPPARGKRGTTMAARRHRAFYLFTSPWIIGFVLLTVIPMGYALWLSFTTFDGISPHWTFVGLANYRELLHDPVTWHALGRSGLFAVTSVPLSIAAGLGLAVLLNRPLKARGLFRTLIYLPAVVPPVGAGLAFKALFDQNSGATNGVLTFFGIDAVGWLADPYARYVLLMTVLWTAGNIMIISLAGLQDVPRELHEAAELDGASAWRTFRSITVPLLSPVLLFQTVTGMIASVQTIMPLLLAPLGDTSGITTVPQSNYLYMMHVFAQYFALGRYGYASALLWVLFVIILAVTGLLFRFTSGAVFYNVGPEAKK
ncbi:carbohydrate ABC transporter permease [Streptomyces acidiscabies]|uniref:Sugar ABC transporter permease n=1 Tax=Streptomyces acidiscabies TaxID=42234 RepID=A0AAP6B9C9_9ACTN|nr:ABC transporter permease subunit [Streptomyces acidiscabies]MBP5936123.1 sugar ABC transporter permease [Streptomyces sp. LBUM 1476]MBZ3915944.1 sugar ABC transporter permease [Streptomyces acidiscabies]MDX2960337.1 sugar ABC transporter permease [Streptomyces acidiscabies]MDX3023761.1 sugar ABC transporter permease [Streptomyces acidiscabies]MDX3793992.1 sugar ABC transporter permease [Streptomyces acidiscabies]